MTHNVYYVTCAAQHEGPIFTPFSSSRDPVHRLDAALNPGRIKACVFFRATFLNKPLRPAWMRGFRHLRARTLVLVAFPGFAHFLSEYRINLDMAAKIFAVSRRTVTRWRTTDRISGAAAQILRAIEWRAPPWNRNFARAVEAGITTLAWEWRQALFAPPGGNWQDYRSPAQRQAVRQIERSMKARREAAREAQRLVRLQAGRKAAETRRQRAEALARGLAMIAARSRRGMAGLLRPRVQKISPPAAAMGSAPPESRP